MHAFPLLELTQTPQPVASPAGSGTPIWLAIVIAVIPAAAAIIAAVLASRSASQARSAESEARKAEEQARLSDRDANRLQALEERIASRKREVYEPFVKALGDMLVPARSEDALGKAQDTIADFQNTVVIWGSDDVVEAFYRFRRASGTTPPPMIIMRLASDLLIAIRRDVAAPDTKMDALRIMGMRINDLDVGGPMEQAFTLPFDELAKREEWTPPWETKAER